MRFDEHVANSAVVNFNSRITGTGPSVASWPTLPQRRWSSKAIWMRSGWLRGSIYWKLLVWGRFRVSKTM